VYQSYAKNTIKVPIAVPQSSAAESTSAEDCESPIITYFVESESEVVLTIIFCPPVKMTFSDHIIEYESDECPGDIVDCCCWWDPTRARQHNRNTRRMCTLECCYRSKKYIDFTLHI